MNRIIFKNHSAEPLFASERFRDTKDPCPVFDGRLWHIFGSGGSSSSETWRILHATGPNFDGPWHEEEPVLLRGLEGPHIAAPGVVFDHAEGLFHMFIQTDFMALGGAIEHLVSRDGRIFERARTAIGSLPGTEEAGVYDPHPAEVNGKKYISYSACAGAEGAVQLQDASGGEGWKTLGPDIYLAESESGSWEGPWRRLGKILAHENVPHHNQRGQEGYEWGLEGSQLVELGAGWVLLIAVCFLPQGARGTRQRVFFAIAKDPKGPYQSLGPAFEPGAEGPWAGGENGHAAGFVHGRELHLFYQARKGEGEPWRFARAVAGLEDLLATLPPKL